MKFLPGGDTLAAKPLIEGGKIGFRPVVCPADVIARRILGLDHKLPVRGRLESAKYLHQFRCQVRLTGAVLALGLKIICALNLDYPLFQIDRFPKQGIDLALSQTT